MFGISTVRLVIYAVAILAFLTLTGIANHYHNSWVEAEKTIAVKQTELDAATEAVKTCSAATDALKKSSDDKAKRVKQAQETAAQVAVKVLTQANKILAQEPKDVDRCKATEQLYQEYKAKNIGGK